MHFLNPEKIVILFRNIFLFSWFLSLWNVLFLAVHFLTWYDVFDRARPPQHPWRIQILNWHRSRRSKMDLPERPGTSCRRGSALYHGRTDPGHISAGNDSLPAGCQNWHRGKEITKKTGGAICSSCYVTVFAGSLIPYFISLHFFCIVPFNRINTELVSCPVEL